ncbi:nuclear transport factor 2 [Anaeramoeba ignava]|uniref:Nuclear transport factor 2 n=1 Tax=Anaeramoeba ignava TaxID=1746090 RepID=A0A9Q0RFD8_ANAIG|nr:nuclear transport factor 2 [Anaeramoeba ignava]
MQDSQIIEFIQNYYDLLKNNPTNLSSFYNKSSLIEWDNTKQDPNTFFSSVKNMNISVEVYSLDHQHITYNDFDANLVTVHGLLQNQNTQFTQTFIIATLNQNYFILLDNLSPITN